MNNTHNTISNQRSVNGDLSRSPITVQHSCRKAFTLIELLVVITIIAILAAVLFPVFAQAKESAKKATCMSNMQQICIANQLYVSDYDDTIVSWTSYESSPNVYVFKNATYGKISDYNVSPANNTYTPGLLDAYLKAFELTGCATGAENLFWDWDDNSFSPKTKGLMSIGFNGDLIGANMSDVEQHSMSCMTADSGIYRTTLAGAPSAGVYSFYSLWNSSGSPLIQGRHRGKINVGWLDGHAKSVPITLRDYPVSAGTLALGITNAILNKNFMGWLCPSGLVPGTVQTWSNYSSFPALSIGNDRHFHNYFSLKKAP